MAVLFTFMEKNNMTKPIIRIHNIETNEIVDREMNDIEFAQYEADQEASAILQTQLQAKADAKTAAQEKLAALGLTVEDLTALGL
jgi:hypothetical protein